MKLKYNSEGLIPAIIQDDQTGKVLMLGYMNPESLKRTRESGVVTFFSRSRQKLWTKGETSGNFLHVREIREDCDGDTLLIQVDPAGPVCHTGSDTCFADTNKGFGRFLYRLEEIIRQKQENPTESSYTAKLFSEGRGKISRKVGEEAVETIIEAMEDRRELYLEETADLLYHLTVLTVDMGLSLTDVEEVLRKRHH
ncbi:MAG: bifunctional phosphoribosyl-AMP cyclohydrolase/phosphoribosyl-ATP diphosphatase HisIE [Spirochaetales bacterium]|nr:bifunctional phosphoribosyl-AMP cyclohydrolase/phosphoribosyl-ATP diphosphatase HisIE [Spirochaetales bacterium]